MEVESQDKIHITMSDSSKSKQKKGGFHRSAGRRLAPDALAEAIKPKALSTVATPERNDPMLKDSILVEGISGMVMCPRTREFSLDYSQFVVLVETSYLNVGNHVAYETLPCPAIAIMRICADYACSVSQDFAPAWAASTNYAHSTITKGSQAQILVTGCPADTTPNRLVIYGEKEAVISSWYRAGANITCAGMTFRYRLNRYSGTRLDGLCYLTAANPPAALPNWSNNANTIYDITPHYK